MNDSEVTEFQPDHARKYGRPLAASVRGAVVIENADGCTLLFINLNAGKTLPLVT